VNYDDLSSSLVVHPWPDDYAVTWGLVYTDSNLSDWLVAREDKTDHEVYEELEAKPQPQKKELTLRLTLSIPIEGLLRMIQRPIGSSFLRRATNVSQYD